MFLKGNIVNMREALLRRTTFDVPSFATYDSVKCALPPEPKFPTLREEAVFCARTIILYLIHKAVTEVQNTQREVILKYHLDNQPFTFTNESGQGLGSIEDFDTMRLNTLVCINKS